MSAGILGVDCKTAALRLRHYELVSNIQKAPKKLLLSQNHTFEGAVNDSQTFGQYKKKDFVKRKYANCESKEGNLLKSDLELTNEGP